MNTSRNQLASTGRQRIAMQIDAKPENEVFQVSIFSWAASLCAVRLQKLHRFQSTST